MIYLPADEPLTLRRLEPGAEYRLTWFDPITGRRSDGGGASADAGGSIPGPRPPRRGQDWVLLVEAKNGAERNPQP